MTFWEEKMEETFNLAHNFIRISIEERVCELTGRSIRLSRQQARRSRAEEK